MVPRCRSEVVLYIYIYQAQALIYNKGMSTRVLTRHCGNTAHQLDRVPRSGIEKDFKQALRQRSNTETAIAWVRSHMGIPGNETADERATFEALLGRIVGSPRKSTEEGVRATPKARRREARHNQGFGQQISDWHRQALSAYTWLRTDRGPQNHWLLHIGKADSLACTCGHLNENGYHITFECPKYRTQRRELLGSKATWEEIDAPDWRKEGDGEGYSAIEAFFSYLHSEIS